MASDNYAVGSNGNLLDASQIVWFWDPNNDEPMAPATSSMAQPQVSATMLNSYITKVPAAHQSTHAPCPSTKVIDPDNIMALKCKPSNPAPDKPSCHPCHASPDHEVDEATEPDLTNSEDNDPVDPDAAYEETKALGDADRDVSVHYS
jgi:hypothetical protein